MSFERSPSGAPEVDVAWLSTHGCALRLVDLRTRHELEGELGHIEGAEHAPLEELDAHAARWATDVPIVVIDRAGRRAARAQERLEALGFEHVASLTGGMVAWRAAGLPIARAPVAPGRVAPAPRQGGHGGHALEGGHGPAALEGSHGAPDHGAPDHGAAGQGATGHGATGHGALGETRLGRDAVAAHLTDHAAIRWTSVAELMTSGTQACIDGRDEGPVVGTPGGDTGELVLALAALEQTAGRSIDLARVPAVFDAYVASFGRFYLHSDEHAMERLGARLRADPRFDALEDRLQDARSIEALVRHPPRALESALLDHMVAPEAVGCGHLRLMLQHPDEYGVRRALTEAVLRSAFRRGWERPEVLRFVVLEGEHHEGAVVRVRLEQAVHAYTRVPMFAPHADGVELFVAHPEVSRYMRHENGAFLLEHREELLHATVREDRYVRRLDALAERQVAATLRHLARALPVYEVRFRGEVPEVAGPLRAAAPAQPRTAH